MNVIAELTSYDDLINALRSLTEKHNVRYATVDDLARIPDGYTGKILGKSHTKRLGWLTTWDVLRALGAKLVLVEDAAALQRMSQFYNDRQANQARTDHAPAKLVSIHLISRVKRHFGALGAKKRWSKTTPEQRSAHMRHMALIRWQKHRQRRKRRLGKITRATRRATSRKRCI